MVEALRSGEVGFDRCEGQTDPVACPFLQGLAIGTEPRPQLVQDPEVVERMDLARHG